MYRAKMSIVSSILQVGLLIQNNSIILINLTQFLNSFIKVLLNVSALCFGPQQMLQSSEVDRKTRLPVNIDISTLAF